jgi:ABC-type sugar transport system ATPase subunit
VLVADVAVDRREFTVRAALTVAPGERVALFGPSGAGKTTVLEAIAGLVPASGSVTQASVTLGGRVLDRVPSWRRRVGLLRQDPGLFPHLSVRQNLLYASSASAAELEPLAAVLGIDELLAAMPARLSGGQAHRVALGRLLLAHCDALLLDEPYSGLDATLRRTLTELVVSLVTSRSVPAVLVTHELADAQAFASRLMILDQGTVLQSGTPSEVVLRPASRRVAELVGYLGFVPVPTGVTGQHVAGVHPGRVVPGADPSRGLVLHGAVQARRPSGAVWEADLRVGDTVITCCLPDEPAGAVTVTILDPPYFDPAGSAVRLATETAE